MKLTRIAAVLGTAAVLVTTLLVQPGAADPAAPQGTVKVKGPGSTYSVARGNAPAIAVESVARGATGQFDLQVVNNGSVATSYAIALVARQGSPELLASAATVWGSTLLGKKLLATGPLGFVTPSIAPGKAATYLVKVPMPASGPAGHVWLDATLRTPNGTVQGTAQIVAEQPAAKGTTANDVFVSQGSQPLVGSSSYRAVISSPALVNAQSATFTVKFENNGPVTQAILIRGAYEPYCNQVLVRNQFGTNLGANALLGQNNSSGYLKPGASVLYRITMTRPSGNCASGPAIPNTVEIRASEAILGQDPDVSALTYHSVLLVAPYGN